MKILIKTILLILTSVFLIEFIEENKSWGDSSKESFYFMIARYLYNKNNNDRYSEIYSEKGFELMQKTKIITEKMN